MEQNISDNKKINKLINYYKDKGLLIVGLNDSQGVNTTSILLKKGLLEYLALALTSEELTPEVINAFSFIMNKTEHIDYFLKNNLSLEEIKLSQIYGLISVLEKFMTDIRLPKFIGQIGNIYRLIYHPKKGDENIKISSSLQQTVEPVLIYSSGINNLMREVGANPFGIKADYKSKDDKPNYYYSYYKINNSTTLKRVIDSIERNYENILGINSKTDIYTLGACIPKSLQSKEMSLYRDFIIAYNEALSNLCKQYGITFVDTKQIDKHHLNSEVNFHLSTEGHIALANHILDLMYQNKFVSSNQPSPLNIKPFEFVNKGASGVIESTSADYEQSLKEAREFSGYFNKRELVIASEHQRETEVFQRVLAKRTK